jgi:hypothetical protein
MSELEVTVALRRDELEKWLSEELGVTSIHLNTKAAVEHAVSRLLEARSVKLGPFGGVDVSGGGLDVEEETVGNKLEVTLRGPHAEIKRACSALQPIAH